MSISYKETFNSAAMWKKDYCKKVSPFKSCMYVKRKTIVLKQSFIVIFVCSVGVKGVQVEEIYDLQSKCQRYVTLNLSGEQ